MRQQEVSTGGHTFRPVDEEIVNAATHGLGLLLSLVGVWLLATQTSAAVPPGQLWTGIVYAVTLVAVYTISTLSHAVQNPGPKHALRVLDQGVIYLLIAGTYTPFMWKYLSAPYHWIGLTLVWSAALWGKYSKVVAQQRVTDFSATTYLWLGWLPAVLLYRRVPPACLGWMFLGGLAYTAGTVFLLQDRRHRHFHAIWHMFVILGSSLHFYAIHRFTLS